MAADHDLTSFLNMVLSGLGLIALIYIIVKIFRLDRFVPPIIPGFGGENDKPVDKQQSPAIVHQQATPQVLESPQAYGDYYYGDLYDNLPNVPQIPEPSVSHNKAGNKIQVEELPHVTSDYNTNADGDPAGNIEPIVDEAPVPANPVPMSPTPIVAASQARRTRNNESWTIQRDSEGNLVGISVDRDVKEY